MTYTAFISYKSEDRDWARKLRDSLVAGGIPIKDLFFDKDRLEVGYEWPEQLTKALAESKHIVFLISANAYKPQSKDPQWRGLWKSQELSGSDNAKSGYRVSGYQVRVSSDAETAAGEELRDWAAKILDTRVTTIRAGRYDTPNYLSIFICPSLAAAQ